MFTHATSRRTPTAPSNMYSDLAPLRAVPHLDRHVGHEVLALRQRAGFLERCGQCFQAIVNDRPGDAWLHDADELDAQTRVGALDVDRPPHAHRALGHVESRRQHADDAIRHIVDRHHAIDHVGIAAEAPAHIRSLIRIGCSEDVASPSLKSRPISGAAGNTVKTLGGEARDGDHLRIARAGDGAGAKLIGADRLEQIRAPCESRRSQRWSRRARARRPPGKTSTPRRRDPLLRNGSGLSSTASTTENIAVVAPMPSASVRTTRPVNAGARRRLRSAAPKALTISSTVGLFACSPVGLLACWPVSLLAY